MSQNFVVNISPEIMPKVIDFVKASAVVKNLSVANVAKLKSKSDEVYASARANAIENAKKQAEEMANNLGVRLGKIISVKISESPNRGGNVYYEQMANTADMLTGMGGEDEYEVFANIIYEIR